MHGRMALPDRPTVDCPSFKVAIVGDGGAVHIKIAFISAVECASWIFDAQLLLAWKFALRIPSQALGMIRFNCLDTAGQEKFGGLRDGFYVHGGVCRYHVKNCSNTASAGCVENIHTVSSDDIVDVENGQVKAKQGYQDLHFVESPALAPPEVRLSKRGTKLNLAIITALLIPSLMTMKTL